MTEERSRMSEPEFSSAPRRHRKRALLICVLMLLALCVGGLYVYLTSVTETELRNAIAEADQQDPGWTILELEAKRAKIPDEQNSAINLRNAKNLMPPQWPVWDYSTRYQGTEFTRDELQTLGESLTDVAPQHQLTKLQIAMLRKELERARPMLAEIYKIADKPHGRYPIAYTKDLISTLLPYTQDTRFVANVLTYDLLLRIQEGDVEGAAKSWRCLIQAERTVGDEPTVISMLVRIAIRRIAVMRLERILAQGEPSEASLAGVQRLLEECEKDRLLLIGARGERALGEGFLLALQNGDTSVSNLLAGGSSGPKGTYDKLEDLQLRIFPGTVKSSRAAMLRLHNQFVEFAKLPVEQQRRQMDTMQPDVTRLPRLARFLVPALQKITEATHRDITDMRCATVMVATERYRKAEGRWPEKIDDLVPHFLTKVPVDPYDSKPLRLIRTKEGMTIYSVGDDGLDNGGKLSDRPLIKGTDRGFRLWDVSKRRLPPKVDSNSDGGPGL